MIFSLWKPLISHRWSHKNRVFQCLRSLLPELKINKNQISDFSRKYQAFNDCWDINYSSSSMPRSHVAGNEFKNGMESRRAGCWMKRRSIILWRWLMECIGGQLDEVSYSIWWLSEKLSEKLERNTGFPQFLQVNSHKSSRSKILKLLYMISFIINSYFRTGACHAGGREFESRRSRQFLIRLVIIL